MLSESMGLKQGLEIVLILMEILTKMYTKNGISREYALELIGLFDIE